MIPSPETERSSDTAPSVEERKRLKEMLTRELPEIPPIYFYDDRGSALFEEITQLDVYYQTRTELGILDRHAGEMMLKAAPTQLVELGSGAGRKIRALLDAWPQRQQGSCTLLDVNESFLNASVSRLRAEYPHTRFQGVMGDFTRDLNRLGVGGRRLTAFFGGTLGNLYPEEQRRFFQQLSRGMVASDTLLVGVDLVKDPARLEAAYNDARGLTGAFNRRALYSLNKNFGANFDPDGFIHRAFYDRAHAWIEMRLVASRAMVVHIPALDLRLDLARGAEIRTEVSCKFTQASLSAAAEDLTLDGWYTDPENLFAMALMRKGSGSAAEG